MINKKRNIIILVLFVVVVFIMIFCFFYYDIFKANDGYNKHFGIEENSNNYNIDDHKEIDTEVFTNDESASDVQSNINDVPIGNNNSNVNDIDSEIEYKDNDNDSNFSESNVVEYFEDMENEVLESSTFKEKFKEYFILIIDFIFYEGEIKGYKFNELSNIAKAKIISFALKIDRKIENYIPNYKESISSTSSRVYTDINGKLVSAYLDVSSEICKNNDSECEKVKEIFGEIKDYCKIGWEFIKELFNNGTSKIKEWYEIYSGK